MLGKFFNNNPIKGVEFTNNSVILMRNAYYLSITLVVMTGCYLSINHLDHTLIHSNYLFPKERSIPFLLWSVWFYWGALLIAFLTPLFIKEKSHLMAILNVNAFSFFINCLIWVVYPVGYPRPIGLALDSGINADFYKQLVNIDTPLNSFPSEHVTLMALLLWICLSNRNPIRYVLMVLGIMGILSVLTTKQHSIVDIISGAMVMLLGLVAYIKLNSSILLSRFQFPKLSINFFDPNK